MKTLLRLTLGLMTAMVFLAACNDDDDDNNSETTLQRLQHVWLVDSTTVRTVTSTTDATVSQPGISTNYFDFRADGNLYYQLGIAAPDTVAYSLVGDDKVVIDGDTAVIETLTNNKLVGSTRVNVNATDYNVIKNYLRR
jgi:hypothetical protein